MNSLNIILRSVTLSTVGNRIPKRMIGPVIFTSSQVVRGGVADVEDISRKTTLKFEVTG